MSERGFVKPRYWGNRMDLDIEMEIEKLEERERHINSALDDAIDEDEKGLLEEELTDVMDRLNELYDDLSAWHRDHELLFGW